VSFEIPAPHMNRSLLPGVVALAALAAGCASPSQRHNHWNASSVEASLASYFLGYDTDTGLSYRDQRWRDERQISQTMTRHLLNWNSENPFQKPSRYGPDSPRDIPHSPIPYAQYYFGWESLVWGAIIYGWTGTFIPIPVGAIIGTFEPGGGREFAMGFSEALEPVRVLTVSFVNETVGEGGPVIGLFAGSARSVQDQNLEEAKAQDKPARQGHWMK
jgi:hypothetical protein